MKLSRVSRLFAFWFATALGVAEHPILILPFPLDSSYRCTQPPGGSTSHQFDSTRHDLDFGVPLARNVTAAAAGVAHVHTATFSGCSKQCVGGSNDGKACTIASECPDGTCRGGGFGNHVTIDHGNDLFTVYAHLETIAVSDGQSVSLRQKIGTADNTGFSCGNHVHFGLHEGDPSEDAITSKSVVIEKLLIRDKITDGEPTIVRGESSTFTCSRAVGHFYEAPPLVTCLGSDSCSGPRGTTFSFNAAGFTANGKVNRFLVETSSGTVTDLGPLTADADGEKLWQFTPACADPTGTFKMYAVDDATGKRSNSVTETITAGICAVPPTCMLSANLATITQGQSSTLSWTTTGAPSSAVIVADVGENPGEVRPPEGGSREVFPPETTKYTMTVTNAAGSNTCQATVSVEEPAPSPPSWSQYQGDAQRTGRSQFIGPGPGATAEAVALFSFQRFGPVVGGDGTVYTSGAGTDAIATVTASDSDGTELWSAELTEAEPFGLSISQPALLANGTLVVAVSTRTESTLYSLNGTNGSIIWEQRIGDIAEPVSEPKELAVGPDGTVYGRLTFTHVDTGRIFAFTPEGVVKWTAETLSPSGLCCFEPGIAISTAATTYVPSPRHIVNPSTIEPAKVETFDPAGSLLWVHSYGDIVFTGYPVISAAGPVYLVASSTACCSGSFYGIDPIDGAIVWTRYSGESPTGIALGLDGTVYGGTGATWGTVGAELMALRPADGSIRWSFPIDPLGKVLTPPLIDVTDRIYFVSGTTPLNPPATGKYAELVGLNADMSEYVRIPIPGSPMPGTGLALGSDGAMYVSVLLHEGGWGLIRIKE